MLLALPRGCKATVLSDCASGSRRWAAVAEGMVASGWRERWLNIPQLPLPPARGNRPPPPDWERRLQCSYHCFSASREGQHCAELTIEGTVQGAFSWAFVKSLLSSKLHC